MTASVSLKNFPPVSWQIGVSGSSSDGVDKKEVENRASSNVQPLINGDGTPTNKVVLYVRYSDPSHAISQQEINSVTDIIQTLPQAQTYADFLTLVNSKHLTEGGKLLLLSTINTLLYGYAYDHSRNQDAVSTNDIFSATQGIIQEMLSNGGAGQHPTAICGGISLFTARLAEDMGFDANAVSSYNHFVAFIKLRNGDFAIIDSQAYLTGTPNFDLANSMYQANRGLISPMSKIIDPYGGLRGQLPTIEGRFILNNLAGYNDPVTSAASHMRGPSLSPVGFAYNAYNPLLYITTNFNPKGDLTFSSIQLNSNLSQELRLRTSITGFNSYGGYDFGAIESGYAGTIALDWLFGEPGKDYFLTTLSYTRADLNAYWFSDGPNSTRKNTMDIYGLYQNYAHQFNIRSSQVRVGNELSEVIMFTSGEGEDQSDAAMTMKDSPFVSLYQPFGWGGLYAGYAGDFDFISSNSQADGGTSERLFSKLELKYGSAIMGGGNIRVGPGVLGLDAVYKTNPYSDSIKVDLSAKKYFDWADLALSCYNQRSNLNGYVPDQTMVSLGGTFYSGKRFNMNLNGSYGHESWPGEDGGMDFYALQARFTF